ncbi:MAG: 2OG-Fe(II) oxygenase [Bacteroidetes bacterium]|nr:2OG-Fe(II) oxygenase [Bacteroidota bacterium]
MKIGILHPGKMGASLAQACLRNGHDVFCALNGRSETTKTRANSIGLIDLGTIGAMSQEVEVIISICMGGGVFPNAEEAIKHGFTGTYIDANHVGDKNQEVYLREMLSRARIRYVEAAIYGWPYPHVENPNAERTIYLSGKHSAFAHRLIDGDIFRGSICETQETAKDIKRWRENRDKDKTMPHTDYGYGIVEFHNVLAVDEAFIPGWLERRRKVEPHDYTIDENGFYVNRGGYKFTKAQVTEAPERYLNLSPEGAPSNDMEFHTKLEKAMFDCIHAYSNVYPEAKDCLQWRSDAHVAVYGIGAGMGMHHDNAIGGASENENPIYNVVSGSLVIYDKCDGGELYFRFIDKRFKPLSGSAVFYPSSYMGSHAVSPTSAGMRISYLEFFGQGTRSGQTRRI